MFNKVFLIIIFTLSLSYAVDDFSSERLLGIEVGYTTLNSRNEIGLNKSNKDVEFGLRIGAQNEEWRTTISASFMKTQGRDYQKLMLNFDRFVWASLYKTDSVVFKPYLGAHVGWLRYTDDISLSDNGMSYGGQMGLALNVLNEVDFDLAYRYTVTDISSVDDIGSFVFSINYLY
jgi:opacity protein-like surface antigen